VTFTKLYPQANITYNLLHDFRFHPCEGLAYKNPERTMRRFLTSTFPTNVGDYLPKPRILCGSRLPIASSAIVTVVTVVALLALSGCTSAKVKLGWKVQLDKTPIASIHASLPKGPGIAPGDKAPLVVAVTSPDGKVLQTEGAGHGKILWKDLKVTTTVVSANQKGVLTLPRDPRISDGKMAHVTITVPSHPDLRADLDISPRYDSRFIVDSPAAAAPLVSMAPTELTAPAAAWVRSIQIVRLRAGTAGTGPMVPMVTMEAPDGMPRQCTSVCPSELETLLCFRLV
jgi:hypothetical protein